MEFLDLDKHVDFKYQNFIFMCNVAQLGLILKDMQHTVRNASQIFLHILLTFRRGTHPSEFLS